jgi:PP-loop superfamily ATP-utilizing enzyme
MSFYLIRDVLPSALLDDFHLDAEGICPVCRALATALVPEGIEADLNLFRASTLLSPGPAAVLALSGGKDSMSALYLARRVLQLNLVALLFDNGHLPRPVVARAQRACRALEVELVVARPSALWRRRFDAGVRDVALHRPVPCDVCGTAIIEALAALAAQRGAPWIIWGTNYFAAWTDRLYAVGRRQLPGNRSIAEINLPFALRLTAAQARRNARRLGANVTAVRGLSSNCRVPHRVSRALLPSLGHVPELEVLALEVQVGHRTRRGALAYLRQRGGTG